MAVTTGLFGPDVVNVVASTAGAWIVVAPAPAPRTVRFLPLISTCSGYAPAATCTVPPGSVPSTPPWTVVYGRAALPCTLPTRRRRRDIDVAVGTAVRRADVLGVDVGIPVAARQREQVRIVERIAGGKERDVRALVLRRTPAIAAECDRGAVDHPAAGAGTTLPMIEPLVSGVDVRRLAEVVDRSCPGRPEPAQSAGRPRCPRLTMPFTAQGVTGIGTVDLVVADRAAAGHRSRIMFWVGRSVFSMREVLSVKFAPVIDHQVADARGDLDRGRADARALQRDVRRRCGECAGDHVDARSDENDVARSGHSQCGRDRRLVARDVDRHGLRRVAKEESGGDRNEGRRQPEEARSTRVRARARGLDTGHGTSSQ